MKKQKFWDCYTTGDDVTRKAYTKDGKQRIKVTRTITRDCATGITDDNINEASDDDAIDWTEERTLEEWLDNPNFAEELRRYLPIIREEVRRYLGLVEHDPEGMSESI
jgi:hypothetical protein